MVSRYNIPLRAMAFVTTLVLPAGDTGVTSRVVHMRLSTDHDDVCPLSVPHAGAELRLGRHITEMGVKSVEYDSRKGSDGIRKPLFGST